MKMRKHFQAPVNLKHQKRFSDYQVRVMPDLTRTEHVLGIDEQQCKAMFRMCANLFVEICVQK